MRGWTKKRASDQPAINHPREHREHIDAALAKEGAS
jgi:hypothetical protein